VVVLRCRFLPQRSPDVLCNLESIRDVKASRVHLRRTQRPSNFQNSPTRRFWQFLTVCSSDPPTTIISPNRGLTQEGSVPACRMTDGDGRDRSITIIIIIIRGISGGRGSSSSSSRGTVSMRISSVLQDSRMTSRRKSGVIKQIRAIDAIASNMTSHDVVVDAIRRLYDVVVDAFTSIARISRIRHSNVDRSIHEVYVVVRPVAFQRVLHSKQFVPEKKTSAFAKLEKIPHSMSHRPLSNILSWHITFV